METESGNESATIWARIAGLEGAPRTFVWRAHPLVLGAHHLGKTFFPSFWLLGLIILQRPIHLRFCLRPSPPPGIIRWWRRQAAAIADGIQSVVVPMICTAAGEAAHNHVSTRIGSERPRQRREFT